MDDTSRAGRARYHDLLAKLTPEERLTIVMELNAAVREMAHAGIARSHPGASPRQRDALFALRVYGINVARRLYGDVLDELR